MSPPAIDGMITLKVDGVPPECAPDDLKAIFSKYGEIGDVYIPRRNNETRGFAFVRFLEQRDADAALENSFDFQGQPLRLQLAQQRRPDNPREFYRERDNHNRDRSRGQHYDSRDSRDSRDRGGHYDSRGHSSRYHHSRSRSPRRGSYRRRDEYSRSPPPREQYHHHHHREHYRGSPHRRSRSRSRS